MLTCIQVVREIIRSFLGEGTDARDPRVNPLYADLSGLGPVYTQAGGDETLADDTRLLDVGLFHLAGRGT